MKRNDISILLAAAWIASALLAPAAQAAEASDRITAKMTPGEIAGIMQKSGYSAYVDKDGEDDPMIIAKGDEGNFGVVFFDCEKEGALPDRYCTDMEFISIFEVDRKPSLAKLNEWNANQAFGRTYLRKDGDVTLQVPINLTHGVSESFIISSLEWWRSMMIEFDKHL